MPLPASFRCVPVPGPCKKWLERTRGIGEYIFMAQTENDPGPVPSVEEIQKAWRELTLKVGQLDAELTAAQQDNKVLRSLMERMIEHRQRSHSELITHSHRPRRQIAPQRPRRHRLAAGRAQRAGRRGFRQPCQGENRGRSAAARHPEGAGENQARPRHRLEGPPPGNWRGSTRHSRPASSSRSSSSRTPFSRPPSSAPPAVTSRATSPRERVVKEFGEEALVFFKDLTTDVEIQSAPQAGRNRAGLQKRFRGAAEKQFRHQPRQTPGAFRPLPENPEKPGRHRRGARAEKCLFAPLLHPGIAPLLRKPGHRVARRDFRPAPAAAHRAARHRQRERPSGRAVHQGGRRAARLHRQAGPPVLRHQQHGQIRRCGAVAALCPHLPRRGIHAARSCDRRMHPAFHSRRNRAQDRTASRPSCGW